MESVGHCTPLPRLKSVDWRTRNDGCEGKQDVGSSGVERIPIGNGKVIVRRLPNAPTANTGLQWLNGKTTSTINDPLRDDAYKVRQCRTSGADEEEYEKGNVVLL